MFKSSHHRLVILPIICVLSIVILVWSQTNLVNGFRILPLAFNPYALPSFLAVFFNSLLFIVISRSKNKSNSTPWYLLFLAALIIWGFCEGMQRITPSPDAAFYWSNLASIGVSIMPVAFLMFCASYADKESINRQAVSWVVIMVSAAVMIHFNAGTDLLIVREVAQFKEGIWGYYWPNGTLFWVYLLWIEAFFISGLAILIKHYLNVKEITRRKQTKLFMISITIPLVFGSITDGILPLFNINPLPTAVLFSSVMSSIIAYGIWRYGLFTLNPATIADNIIDTMNEGVIITDSDYKIESVNKGILRILGNKKGGLTGSSIIQIFSPAALRSIKPLLDQQFRTGPFVKISEAEIQNNNKTFVAVSLSVSKVEVNGSIAGFVFVFSDISELKERQKELETAKNNVEQQVKARTFELRNTQARLEASINSLKSGFIMVDDNQNLLTINTVAKNILTKANWHKVNSSREWDMSVIAEISGNVLNLGQNIEKVLRTHKPVEGLGINIGKRIINLYVNPITNGVATIGCLIILEDVTEAKVLERSKNEFFSIASHELRTPLTAIRGNASLLSTYFKANIKDEEISESIEDIHASSVRLIEIVNDFLDLSRSEQGKIEYSFTEFNLQELAVKVIHELNDLANTKGLHLKIGPITRPEPLVKADYKRTEQVVLNLVSNAINYSDYGVVSIEVTSNADQIELRVRDTGKGIAEVQQALLFRKFQQAGKSILTREPTKGTGLGLYIARLLTNGMNGSLSIESSAPGKGSVFLLTLPKANTASRLKQ